MAQDTQKENCYTSLRLLMDESHSIEPMDWRKQVYATAAAIEHPDIVKLFERNEGVAVAVDSFDDEVRNRLGWQVIRTPEEASAVAARLRAMEGDQSGGSTDIGNALTHAIGSFANSPCIPEKMIIDISTDGVNSGAPYAVTVLDRARKTARNQGVVINGIGVDGNGYRDGSVQKMLEEKVIVNGFATGTSWTKYEDEIRKKIQRELSFDLPAEPSTPVPSPHVQLAQGRQR